MAAGDYGSLRQGGKSVKSLQCSPAFFTYHGNNTSIVIGVVTSTPSAVHPESARGFTQGVSQENIKQAAYFTSWAVLGYITISSEQHSRFLSSLGSHAHESIPVS
jgi:hypothetical protein